MRCSSRQLRGRRLQLDALCWLCVALSLALVPLPSAAAHSHSLRLMSWLARSSPAAAAMRRVTRLPSFLVARARLGPRPLPLPLPLPARCLHSPSPRRIDVSVVNGEEWLEAEGLAEARDHALRRRHQRADAQKAAAAAEAAADDAEGVAVSVRNSQRRIPIDVPLLRARTAFILRALRLESYALDVWVTTDATLRRLNRQYRSKDKPTDILSFPFQALTPPAADLPPSQRPLPPVEHGVAELGQIVISAPYVLRDAAKLDQTVDQRLRTLIVHGVCHLLGYDHEEARDAELMDAEEARLLRLLDEREAAHPPE